MQHTFWKEGEYNAEGGIYVRNNLKEFFATLKEKGLNPVGIIVDDESFNLEILTEKKEAEDEVKPENT